MSKIRLSELVEFNPKRHLKKGNLAPFVEMAALSESGRDVAYIYEREYKGGGAKFSNGDTLFARITPCLENGKTAKVTKLEDGVVGHGSTEFIVMSPNNPTVDEDYVYYVARMPDFRAYAQARMEGTSGRQRVSWQSLAEFELEIPDAASRKQAGRILKAFDDKIQLNNQINQTLEQMAQAIFKSWFVDFEPVKAKIIAKEQGADLASQELAAQAIICGAITLKQLAELKQNLATTLQLAIDEKLSQDTQTPINAEQLKTTAALFPNELVESELGEVPTGWEVKPFSDWVKVTKGKSITRKKAVPGDVPVVAGGLLPAYWHNVHNVEGPAITISASGANAGYVNLYSQNIWSSDSSYIDKKSTSYFYTAYVCLKYYQKAIYDMQTGAAQPHIYPKDFERLNVVLGSVELLEKLENLLFSFFEKAAILTNEAETLTQLRDTLLPKLLSGELSIDGSLASADKPKTHDECNSVADLLRAIESDLPPKSHFYSKTRQPVFDCYIAYELPSSMKGLTIRGNHAEGGAEYFKLPKFLWELRNNQIVNSLFSATVGGTTAIPLLPEVIVSLMYKFMGEKVNFDQSSALVLLSFPKSIVRQTSELLETASKLSANAGVKLINEEDLYIILKNLQQHGLVQPLDSHSVKWRLMNKFRHEIEHWD